MVPWCRRSPDGALVLAVHAQPGAKRTEVAGVHGASLRIRVAAPPLEGRANEALVDFLASAFRVPRRNVTLAAGAKSREKRFEIRGSAVDPATLFA